MINYISLFIKKYFPKKLFGIYFIVGVWNTIFGTFAYIFSVWLFCDIGKYGYLIGAVLSTILGVTHSFLTYKFFVFKTKGNYWAEYIKCWAVYGVANLINFALLPISVESFRFFSPEPYKKYAPYLGGVVLTGITVLVSFVGHSKITFKKIKLS